MRFHLTTIGSGRLEDEKGKQVTVPGLALILLAYVRYRAEPVTRRELGQFFWPDAQEAGATNLRSLLRRFSLAFQAREVSPLIVTHSHVTLRDNVLEWDFPDPAEEEGVDKLKRLIHAVSRGFLGTDVGRQGRVGRWILDVQTTLVSQLRDMFLLHARIDQTLIPRAELKRAAMLLLDHLPHDEEVRSALRLILEPSRAQVFEVTATRADAEAASDASYGPAPDLPRVALLPPDMSSDPQGAGLVANALIEDLTIGLCASRNVSVVAPYTAEKIRASDDKVTLLQQHQVLYALDTRRSGDFLFAQLIFLPADEVVWATRFRLGASETVEQRSVIAQAIQTSITERMQRRIRHVESFRASPDAYYAYLSGIQVLSQLSLPSLRRARKQFREALRHDKDLTLALAGMSRTLTLEWVLTTRGDSALLEEAERLAKRAIDIDGGSAVAFKELGVSQLYQANIDESLWALGQAEELSPHYADAIFSHADSLTHASRPAAALKKINLAISLNPLPPDTYYWAAAGASFFLQDYEEALAFIHRMQDKQPASRLAAACYGMLGDQSRARVFRNRFLADNPTFDIDQWLSMVPHKEQWQTDLYREGLIRAGFKGD